MFVDNFPLFARLLRSFESMLVFSLPTCRRWASLLQPTLDYLSSFIFVLCSFSLIRIALLVAFSICFNTVRVHTHTDFFFYSVHGINIIAIHLFFFAILFPPPSPSKPIHYSCRPFGLGLRFCQPFFSPNYRFCLSLGHLRTNLSCFVRVFHTFVFVCWSSFILGCCVFSYLYILIVCSYFSLYRPFVTFFVVPFPTCPRPRRLKNDDFLNWVHFRTLVAWLVFLFLQKVLCVFGGFSYVCHSFVVLFRFVFSLKSDIWSIIYQWLGCSWVLFAFRCANESSFKMITNHFYCWIYFEYRLRALVIHSSVHSKFSLVEKIVKRADDSLAAFCCSLFFV